MYNFYTNRRKYAFCISQANDEINVVRRQVLDFFNADEDEYSVVFTSGATAAIKLVGNHIFPNKNADKSIFCYSRESHTSIVGLRQLSSVFKVLDAEQLSSGDVGDVVDAEGTKLLAFPAMSNFCGKKFPVSSIVDKFRKKVW